MEVAKPVLPFEPNGLYLVITDELGTQSTATWHWVLYLAYTAVTGKVFHIIETSSGIPAAVLTDHQQLPPTPPATGNDTDPDTDPANVNLAPSPAPSSQEEGQQREEHKQKQGIPISNRPATVTSKRAQRWVYESGPSSSALATSTAILLALKVAVVEPPEDMHEPLAERVARVNIREGDTSRTWVMEVLHQLDDEGWVALGSSATSLGGKNVVSLVEKEATDIACANSLGGRRTAEVSRYFVG